jgi:hypothetical protein
MKDWQKAASLQILFLCPFYHVPVVLVLGAGLGVLRCLERLFRLVNLSLLRLLLLFQGAKALRRLLALILQRYHVRLIRLGAQETRNNRPGPSLGAPCRTGGCGPH